MTDQEKKDLIDKIKLLEWTEEKRPSHVWHTKILVRRQDVIAAIEASD